MDSVRQSIYKPSILCLCMQIEPKILGQPHSDQGGEEGAFCWVEIKESHQDPRGEDTET